MTIFDLYSLTKQRLRAAEIRDHELEAEILLGHVLGLERAQLFLAARQEVGNELCLRLEQFLTKRLNREPLAYIFGEQEFWSLSFHVGSAVLIPRPETELLLETALTAVRAQPAFAGPVLDLGTGSGVIAVVLARELPEVEVYGVDRSYPALEVARANVQRHGVAGQVHLVNSSWLECFALLPVFELLVSNPPYIAAETLPFLQPEVRSHEPRMALDGGKSGLEAIAAIAASAFRVLRPGAGIFLEIGADQGQAVLNIFHAAGHYEGLRVHTDYAGLPRIFEAKRASGE